jgi:hypothetical protein
MKKQTDRNGAPLPDISDSAIQKKVMSEAIQHPTTLYPAALSILSTLYMGLVNFNETAFAIAAGSSMVALASWIYHYFIRGDHIKDQYLSRLGEKRQSYKEKQVINIEQDCRVAGFSEGENAAKELKEAYMRFKRFLETKTQTSRGRSAQRFLTLAGENYDQGVNFLQKALSIYTVLDDMDEAKLKKELKAWEAEVKKLDKKVKQEGDHSHLVIQALQERIKSHKRRLKLFTERSESLKNVLAQCEILEATLDSAYLELVDLFEGDHMVKQENVASNLERAFTSARIVEDRMRDMENPKAFDDSIYAQAAKAESRLSGRDKQPGQPEQNKE